MKKSDALKQERASKIEAQGNLITKTETEKRSFSETETTEFNKLDDEIRALDTQIEQAEKIEAAQKRAAAQAGEGEGIKGTKIEKAEKREGGEAAERRKILGRASVSKALRTLQEKRSLEGAEKEMHEIGLEQNLRVSKEAGVQDALLHIPFELLRAAQHTVTQDSGDYGGQLVHDNAPRVQMPFDKSDVLTQLGVTVLTGLSGGDIPLPVASNYSMAWLAETAEIQVQKQKFEGPVLSPKRLGGAAPISNRLIMQSTIDVEALIRRLLLLGYGRSVNAAVFNGSGQNNQPRGIFNNTGVQLSTVNAQSIPTKAMITELVKLVELADSTNTSLAYAMNPALKDLLQNIKVDSGSGRFLMELKDELNGQKAVSTNHVPDLAGNHALVFGDWSQLYVGEWGALSILADPYTGALSNSTQLVINAHVGIEIAQPNAFAVNKFLNAEAGS